MPEDPKAPSGGNLVQYSEWKEEDADTEQAELDRSGSEFLKVKEGRHVYRFLPGRPGSGPFKVTWQHFFNIPGRQTPVVFNCPWMMAHQKDQLCAEVERLRASGNKADRDRAFEIAPKIRVFANIIDRKNPDRGPQVWGYGKTVHEQLVQIRKDPDGGDFTHPTKGFDIVVTRAGTGKTDTEYFCRAARNTSPLHPDTAQMNEWISAARDLARYGEIPTNDVITKIMHEPDRQRDDRSEREVNEPRQRTSARTSSAQDEIEGELDNGPQPRARQARGRGEDDIPF